MMDFKYRKESAAVVLLPESDRAKQWTLDNLQVRDWQSVLSGIRIRHDCITEVIDALAASGLSIEAN
jgi:hypothetical protein